MKSAFLQTTVPPHRNGLFFREMAPVIDPFGLRPRIKGRNDASLAPEMVTGWIRLNFKAIPVGSFPWNQSPQQRHRCAPYGQRVFFEAEKLQQRNVIYRAQMGMNNIGFESVHSLPILSIKRTDVNLMPQIKNSVEISTTNRSAPPSINKGMTSNILMAEGLRVSHGIPAN